MPSGDSRLRSITGHSGRPAGGTRGIASPRQALDPFLPGPAAGPSFLLLATIIGVLGFGTGVSGSSRRSSPERGLPVGVRVDLNRARVSGLMVLPGIGRRRAEAIAKSRARDGPFVGPEDLARVPGIGEGLIRRIAPFVATRDARTAPNRTRAGRSSRSERPRAHPRP